MKNKILKALRNLDQNDIAALTTHAVFGRGFDYFSGARVLAFTWSQDNTELTALIRGSLAPYQITIKYDLEEAEEKEENNVWRLEYHCTCPAWERHDHCKHVICTLLTASHLLNDQPIPGFTGAKLKAQIQNLTDDDLDNTTSLENTNTGTRKNSHKKSSLHLHLLPLGEIVNVTHPRSAITLFDGNTQLQATSPATPGEYAPFLDKNFEPDQREKLFREILAKQKFIIPIIVHMRYEQLSITPSEQLLADYVTELEIVDGIIVIRQLARVPGQDVMREVIRVGQRLIVDAHNKKLLILNTQKNNQWDWAEQIINHVINQASYSKRSLLLDDEPDLQLFFKNNKNGFPITSTPFTITTIAFNRSFPLLTDNPNIATSYIFKEKDVVMTPEHIQPTRAIAGTIDSTNQRIFLQPQILVDGQAIPLDYRLNRYLSKIDHTLSSWLRTKTRRTALEKTIFSLIGTDNQSKANKLMKTTAERLWIDGPKYTNNAEIMNYFQLFYQTFLSNSQADEPLDQSGRTAGLEEQIVATSTNFYKITLDYTYLWQPFTILSDFFDGCFMTQTNQQAGFMVPLDDFYETFAELEKVLGKQNIELSINKKRVQTISLDISVDASQTQSGDWFDLAPQILSQGIMLTHEQRDLLFSDDRMIETADGIAFLDAQTREILRLLSTIFSTSGDIKHKTIHNIVQLPRLRVLDLLELRKSGATVILAPKDELLVDRLTHFSKIEKIALPKNFIGELREYQQAGYHWLAFLYKHRLGACLADDMGLGKTIQTIVFLGGIFENIIESHVTQKNQHAPHIIVVPPTLLFNWQQELHKFYPDLKVTAYAGAGRQNNFDGFDIVLTTYDTVRLDIEMLKTMQFHVLILDEAQAIKNIKSARAAAVRQLKSIFTISLTGTPLENHIGEYYSIIDVALPGLLPSYKLFMEAAKRSDLDSLIKKMNTFVLRRTKDAILKELPPKVESNIILEMTSKQKKVYATMVTEIKRAIDFAYQTKSGAQANIIALTALLRLRQICVSPQLVDKQGSSDAPKIDYLTETLTELVSEGNSALVFSQFIMSLDMIEKSLTEAGLKVYRIDGSTSMAQRKKIVESFQNNDNNTFILLLSLKTGGVGLNLTRANYVFHLEPWWNPAVENQASDRSHRIGQNKTVFVTRLVMRHSIEEKMMALKEEKQKLFNDIMDNVANKTTSLLTKKDFDLLLE